MADYDINAVTRRVVYSGASGLGPYAFAFEILEQTDVVAYFNATKLTLTTDYTVTINSNGTGSVNIVTGGSVPSTPIASDQIVLVGSRDIERTTDFVTAGELRASALNEQLDSLTIFDQQLAEENKRTIRAPVYDPALVEDGGVVDMTLPEKASRAGKTLAFDDNGNPVVGEDIGNWRGDWAASVAYDVRDLVRDPVDLNIYRVNTAHTSSGVAPLTGNADYAKFDLVIDAASVADAEAAQLAAEAARDAAQLAQTAAETAETNAELSETNAGNSATASAASATASASSASAAATSETNAATSETNAATSETNAASSASSASSSASTATTKASEASTSATNAAASATNAAASATNAATSATNAATSETNAATSASNAGASASNAASSASSASSAQTAAEAARDSALAAFDNFDDKYLGEKASDPTVDNDGDPLVAGALYFNTTDNEMRVYNGTSWVNAYADGATFVAKAGDTMTGNLSFGDNNKAIFGAGSDLEIYHDGSNSIVKDAGTGSLELQGSSWVILKGATSGSWGLAHLDGAQTNLYHNGSLKLGTTSTGVSVTGNATFADNNKAIFGSGSDLQIYHTGSDSVIQDAGQGDLYIKASNNLWFQGNTSNDIMARFQDNGAVTLYHDNSAKLSTTATGVDVTGTVTADNYLYLASPNGSEFEARSEDSYVTLSAQDRNLNYLGNRHIFYGSDFSERMRIDSSGDISFYEDTGTTEKLKWLASDETLKFADNSKATFGDGSDLQIYHDGSHSNIKDAGTGNLRLQGENLVLQNSDATKSYAVAVNGGAIDLRHNNSVKMATTATGISVTGNVVSQVGINAQTGTTYTTVLSDQSKLVTLNNASAIALTIPANSSVAYPVGTQIDLSQFGAGQVTVAGASGVTVNSASGLKLRAQYSSASCIKVDTDTWLLVGDLEA